MRISRLARFILLASLCVPLSVGCLRIGRKTVPPTPPASADVLSLNGDWKFKLLAENEPWEALGFERLDFDDASWAGIAVPGCWEMLGFEEPRFGTPSATQGLYRRRFIAPKEWRGRRVIALRFEGVLSTYQCWLNGQPVGASEVISRPNEFKVAGALRPGAENVLAVRVHKLSGELQSAKTGQWSLSGIHRDVKLFAAPDIRIESVSLQTAAGDDEGIAELAVDLRISDIVPRISTKTAPDLNLSLFDPEDKLIQKLEIQPTGGKVHYTTQLKDPQLWSAETPRFYTLKCTLKDHTITRRIGLREAAVEESPLKINGRAVQLRGILYDELHPDVGRALREEHWLADLRLMKRAHINFLRLAGGRPHPRFLELCDELGLYVALDEPADRYHACVIPAPHIDDRLPRWADPALRRPASELARARPQDYIWLDEQTVFDCGGEPSSNTLVYPDRAPKADYWNARAANSPIVIDESVAIDDAPTTPVPSTSIRLIRLTLRNRYNSLDLKDRGIVCNWALFREKSLVPGAHGRIPCALPPGDAGDLFFHLPDLTGQERFDHLLRLEFKDATGAPLYEKTIRILPGGERPDFFSRLAAAPAGSPLLARGKSGSEVFARFGAFELLLKNSGMFSIRAAENKNTLVELAPLLDSALAPNAPLCSPDNDLSSFSVEELAADANVPGLRLRRESGGAHSLADYRLRLDPGGWIEVECGSISEPDRSASSEGRFFLRLPDTIDHVRWLGEGPYPARHGTKAASANRGIYRIDGGDINFAGARDGVDLFAATDAEGYGVGLIADGANIAWRTTPEGIILGYAAPTPSRFLLVPLAPYAWPALFGDCFGPAAPAPAFVNQPYLRGYE